MVAAHATRGWSLFAHEICRHAPSITARKHWNLRAAWPGHGIFCPFERLPKRNVYVDGNTRSYRRGYRLIGPATGYSSVQPSNFKLQRLSLRGCKISLFVEVGLRVRGFWPRFYEFASIRTTYKPNRSVTYPCIRVILTCNDNFLRECKVSLPAKVRRFVCSWILILFVRVWFHSNVKLNKLWINNSDNVSTRHFPLKIHAANFLYQNRLSNPTPRKKRIKTKKKKRTTGSKKRSVAFWKNPQNRVFPRVWCRCTIKWVANRWQKVRHMVKERAGCVGVACQAFLRADELHESSSRRRVYPTSHGRII